MAYDIGTAKGTIEIDYNGRGVAEAQAGLTAVQSKASAGAAAFAGVGKVATRTGLVIAAGLAGAVVAAANFEQKMSNIGAVSGATGKELDGLREKALQLGKDTMFSATESADAIEELIKAGISVKDVLNGAADATVNLAAAGGVDMATAASVMSAAMNSFGVAGRDAAKVADLIAGAANASATDVRGVGEAFKYVAPLASAAGISIKDTTTAIAVMAQSGIEGSMAGTTLRGMLQNLTPATAAAAAKMKELGIITKDGSNQFYDAQGNTRSLADISEVLKQSLSGLNDEQMTQALTTMFGARAMAGAVALAKQGEDGFNKLAGAIGKVSAADVAAEKMDNLKGSFEELKGSVETLAIEIGTPLLGALRSMVDALTGAANWFLGLSDGMQKLVGVGAAATAAILLTVGAIIKIVLAVQKAHAAFVAIRGVMATTWVAALGPIALVVAAIAAVVAIFVLLYKKNETFRNAVNAAWQGIQAVVSAVVAWFMSSVVPAFVNVFNAIKGPLQGLWAFFRQVWSDLVQIVSNAWSIMGPAVIAGINLIKSIVVGGFNVLASVVSAAMGVIKAVFVAGWNIMVGVLGPVWNVIKSVVTNGINIVKNVILGVLNVLKGNWSGAWNNMKAILQSVWNIIKSVVTNAVNAVKNVIVAAWNAVKSITSSVWNGIKSVISSVIAAIKSVISAGVNAAKGVITSAWNAVKAATVSIWNGIKQAVSSAVSGLMDIIQAIPGKIKGFFSGAAGWLVSAGADIIRGLISGITSMIGNAISAVKGAVGGIIGAAKGALKIGSPSKVFIEIGKMVGKGFIQGVVGTRTEVVGGMTQLIEALRKTSLKGLTAMAVDTRSKMKEIAKEYEKGLDDLKDAQEQLKALKQASDQLRAQTTASIIGTGNIAGFAGSKDAEGNDLPVTFANIMAGLEGSVVQAEAFGKVIQDLQQMGLNQTALEQLIAAGPTAGLAAANAILQEGANAVTALNVLQAKLVKQAEILGRFAADNMYKAGIQTAQGLVDGIRSQIHAAVDAMAELAAKLVAAVQKKLKIKSPSKIMRGLGADTGAGFALGIEGMAGMVAKAGRTMADAARLGAVTANASGIGGASPTRNLANTSTAQNGPISVKVFIGDTELTDMVRVQIGETLQPLRRMTRQGAF